MTELLSKGGTIMATRLEAEKAEAVRKDLPEAIYYKRCKDPGGAADFRGKRMRMLQSCAGENPWWW